MGVWTRLRAAGVVCALAAALGTQVLTGQAQAAPGCQPYGLIGEYWANSGGNASALGPCIGDEADFLGIRWEPFVNGIAIWTPFTGVVPFVWGAAPVPAPTSRGAAALAAAQTRLGASYVYGGTGPWGFDCSGLVQWSFAQAGVPVPRITNDQANVGVPVSRGALQPGDVVFFYGLGHDGIYAGNNQVIHAPDFGQVVSYQNMDYMPFTTARRY
ncbi:MAG: C40 family peptidase [Mycobacteriaceae bacterium]